MWIMEKLKVFLLKMVHILHTKAIIIASGTYLKSKVIIGDLSYNEGPSGLLPANELI